MSFGFQQPFIAIVNIVILDGDDNNDESYPFVYFHYYYYYYYYYDECVGDLGDSIHFVHKKKL